MHTKLEKDILKAQSLCYKNICQLETKEMMYVCMYDVYHIYHLCQNIFTYQNILKTANWSTIFTAIYSNYLFIM